MANAEIIAIGSELLTPQRLDTNSLVVTELLNAIGVEVSRKQVIGDDRARLTEAIRSSLDRADILILTGGLGPTEDDVTRDAAAAALGRSLVHSPEQEAILQARFYRLRRKMAENNRRQTYLVDQAEAIPNSNGTAPGQFIRSGEKVLILLPGPPRELKPMVADEIIPRLKALLPREAIKVRSFRITGMGESDLDALIAPVYTRYENVATTVLAGVGDLWVHLRARCATEAEANALLTEVGDPIAELLGDRVYSTDAEQPLEDVVGQLLRLHHATVATAESCTGGLIASRLTELAGSSDFFQAGFVTYNNEQKANLLGVPQGLLTECGAVSEPVAAAMAEGARLRSGANYALSTTGFSGPSGGTEQNPVGTVYIGVAGPATTKVTRLHYGSDRYRHRLLSTQAALDILRRQLL